MTISLYYDKPDPPSLVSAQEIDEVCKTKVDTTCDLTEDVNVRIIYSHIANLRKNRKEPVKLQTGRCRIRIRCLWAFKKCL